MILKYNCKDTIFLIYARGALLIKVKTIIDF